VAKNGILLVDYANTLRLQRGMPLLESIRESAVIRFRPIVMTTAAMVMGMLPLALGITEGAEFRKSMGTVIIGGLTSSHDHDLSEHRWKHSRSFRGRAAPVVGVRGAGSRHNGADRDWRPEAAARIT